ncbi:MAG: hypothetical protein HEEMFOPI_01669 [Holosporales bacterium]
MNATVSAAFDKDYKGDSLLEGVAADALGAGVANCIGDAAFFGSMDDVQQTLAHGALGAAVGGILEGEKGITAGALSAMIAENVAKYAYKTGDAIQDAAKIGKITGIIIATLSTGNLTASQFAANNAVDHNFLGVRQRVLSVASTITIDMLKDPLKRQIILSALASGGAFVWQKIMTVLGINQSGDQFTYDGKAFDTLNAAFADSCAKHNITPDFVTQMMDIVISKPTIHVTPKVENEGLKIESFPVEEPDKEPLMEGYYCPENPLEQEGFDVYDGEKITIFTSEEDTAAQTKRGMQNPKIREAAERGKEAHKNYGTALGDKFKTEVTLPSGQRPDAIDWANREVRELKPDNARAIARGERQVAGYKTELEEITGESWTSIVDVYRTRK